MRKSVEFRVVDSKEFTWIVSAVVTGNIEEVRKYLDISTESDIFLHGVSTKSITTYDNIEDEAPKQKEVPTGETILHEAACEEYPEMVELLLQRGADPNAQDIRGRVPLTEAALWGRLSNVKVLLEYMADKNLECLRHGHRLPPIDFAKPTRENTEERYERAGSNLHIYKENTYERDQDRATIVRLLRDDEEDSNQDQSRLAGFTFTGSPMDETLLTLVAHFNIPSKWKTVGVLYRGPQLPTVAAMSGWAHEERNNIQIGGRNWTAEVLRLCEVIGYHLPVDVRDQGKAGQYHACHAEKQLIAFFFEKHLFMSQEVEAVPDIESFDDEYPGDNEQQHKRDLFRLLRVEPPVKPWKATIMVCRPICDDCMRFVQFVNQVARLDITIFHRCLEQGCQSCRQ